MQMLRRRLTPSTATADHHRKRHLALAVPALAAIAAAAAPAHAEAAELATATSSEAIGMRYTGTTADNDVRVTLAGTKFTVDDTGPIEAGAGCAPVAGDATKVTCVAFKQGAQFKQFQVQLLAGNDKVKNLTSSAGSAGAPMFANGASGNDVLEGSAKVGDELRGSAGLDDLIDKGGLNELNGGTGDDGLLAGANTDKLIGGSGRDLLDGGGSDDQLDGGSGADTIDGGPAGISPGERHDRVLYSSRSNAVSVDLARTDASQGEPGEGDTIRDVEDVSGGSGNDTLFGNAANNFVFGADGNDTLGGEEGLDVLTGGEGADILSASPENGFFTIAPDGQPDIMDCSVKGSSVDPGDAAFRVVADGDQAVKCAQVFDL